MKYKQSLDRFPYVYLNNPTRQCSPLRPPREDALRQPLG